MFFVIWKWCIVEIVICNVLCWFFSFEGFFLVLGVLYSFRFWRFVCLCLVLGSLWYVLAFLGCGFLVFFLFRSVVLCIYYNFRLAFVLSYVDWCVCGCIWVFVLYGACFVDLVWGLCMCFGDCGWFDGLFFFGLFVVIILVVFFLVFFMCGFFVFFFFCLLVSFLFTLWWLVGFMLFFFFFVACLRCRNLAVYLFFFFWCLVTWYMMIYVVPFWCVCGDMLFVFCHWLGCFLIFIVCFLIWLLFWRS